MMESNRHITEIALYVKVIYGDGAGSVMTEDFTLFSNIAQCTDVAMPDWADQSK